MAGPVSFATNVGYIPEADVYISFTEYYGDGTIYGRSSIVAPTGEPVMGAGKTKADLIAAGALVADDMIGSIAGGLLVVPNEAPPAEVPVEAPPAETPAEAPPAETPAEVPVEAPPAEVPAEAPPAETPAEAPVEAPPVEVPVEVPAEAPVEAPVVKVEPYAVQVTVGGFTVICKAKDTTNVSVRVDAEAKVIYFDL